ncbi:MAG: M28 family peptidase [Clostridia bacterium]|nr:M28 family peptidase [Clostridia bacterium]
MLDLKQNAKDNLQYMLDGIRYVCETFKNRLPGSEGERGAQDYFKKELGEYADTVIDEDFNVHPGAFFGFIPPAAIFSLLSIVFYWIAARYSNIFLMAAVVMMTIAVLMFLFEFMFYRAFVDFLFPKKVSKNVYAVRKSEEEPKRRIIFCGHADVVHEWRYSYLGEIKTLGPVMAGGVVGMLYVFFVTIAYFIRVLVNHYQPVPIEGVWKVLGIAMFVFAPFIFAIIFFINYKVIVDGANDNLTACYISMAVLKILHEKGIRFKNTEVGCLIAGGEEAGIRGSRAFARKHKQELQEIETVTIAMDTQREIEALAIYTIGCTGTSHADEGVGDLLHEAGLNCGIDMPRADLYPGAIDSDAFAQEGLMSAGFCGVNHNPKRYYHTREDTPDNLNPACIQLSLEICLEALRLYDEKGGIRYWKDQRKKK